MRRTLVAYILAVAALVLLSACGGDENSGSGPSTGGPDGGGTVQARELIVLAAPASNDSYYDGITDEIVSFHIAYAESIIDAGDDVLVLADSGFAQRYISALGSNHVLEFGQEDVWARDFGTSNPVTPVMFRYTAAGQGGGRGAQAEADAVQDALFRLAREAGLQFAESGLLNDGGNLVDDYAGRAVISRKFLRDNGLTETDARQQLSTLAGLDEVAFIETDDPGGLEHADGMVAFLEPNVLVINEYPDDPAFAAQLRRELEEGLPDARISTIVAPYDPEDVFDPRFGSACGFYTNMLVTPDRIYLPQFGIPEDTQAYAAVRALTSKTIVRVQSDVVCTMGGGVRCMSWQLRGENARRLRAYADSR